MSDYGVLTKKTPIVYAMKKNDAIANISGLPDIYHKEFDVTEFIGERLATIQGIKTNHYFPVCFEKHDLCRPFNFNDDNLRIGSFDFKKENVLYLTAPKLFFYGEQDDFNLLLQLCKDNRNKEEFIEENLKMFGLDIYMWQKDRGGNGYYEFYPNGEIHFGPLFDYEDSLNLFTEDDISYTSDFFPIVTLDDYHKLIERFPRLREILESYLDIELDKEIMAMARDRCFDISKLDMGYYRKFDDLSHKRLEKILK